MSLEVKYIDAPTGIKAEVTGTNKQPFVNYNDVIEGGLDIPWATFESKVWKLDGTMQIMDDSPKNMGWWSYSRSSADGTFSEPETIEISFDEPQSTPYMTFVFWPSTNQWISEMLVSWYNGDNLVSSVTAYPDATQWEIRNDVGEFDKVTIQVIKTGVYQKAKIQRILVGRYVVFGGNDLVSVRLLNEVDPSSCELPIDTMSVEVYNRDSDRLIPQTNQKMELYKDNVLIASQYIQEGTRESRKSYKFSCQSAVGLLGDDFLGGIYIKTPVKTLLDEVLGGISYTLDGSFADIQITGYLPVCTRREALQQIVFAIGAVVSTQKSESIVLSPVPTGISDTITGRSIFQGASIKNDAKIARFILTAHSYTESLEEETLLENEFVSGKNVLYLFDAPHYAYTIAGGTITGRGDNWVTITADGNVTLKAKKYLHSTSLYEKINPNTSKSEANNTLKVTKATLINSDNVQDALNRLYDIKTLRQTLTQTMVVSGQKAGQIVSSLNPWGTYTQGYITSMDSTLTQGGHTASVKILGREVAE